MLPELVFNFEKLVKIGIDAIDVTINEFYYLLYGWDCDTTLIMNPNIIIPIAKGGYKC